METTGGFLRTLAPCLALLAACASSPGRDNLLASASWQPILAQAEEKKGPEWEPPPPNEKGPDWVRLKTGELLPGEIRVLRRNDLEFDSREFDIIHIDWFDVTEVRSPRTFTCTFENHVLATGTLLIRDDVVIVGAGEERKQFPRKKLESIVRGGPSERDYWSAKVSLGFTGRAGNTNQSDLAAFINLVRRSPSHKVETTYSGAFGKLDGEENVNNHRITAGWDYFFSRKFYVTPITVDFYRDLLQNIAGRVTPGAGVGYDVFYRRDLEWTLTASGGYRVTRFDSVEAGQDKRDSTASLSLGTGFKVDLTKKFEFQVNYSIQIGIPDTSDTNHHLLATFSLDLWRNVDLDITLGWDRVGNPQSDSDGIVPVPDDYSVTFGFGWEF